MYRAFGITESTSIVSFAVGCTVIEFCWRKACIRASEGYRIRGQREGRRSWFIRR